MYYNYRNEKLLSILKYELNYFGTKELNKDIHLPELFLQLY